MTAQAAAEAILTSGSYDDYGGAYPNGYYDTGGNEAGLANDSASTDQAIMISPSHAGTVLSAASDFAGIGVACNPSGGAVIIELFADADATSASAGQARLQAELAANNEYVASGGTVTTVYEPPQDGGAAVPAQDVFPQNPIAAGSQFASGVDWTCSGPVYPAGGAPVTPLPPPVTGIAASPDGGGYALVDGAGAVSVHGDASFHGGANGLALTSPIAHIVPTPDGGGYWLVAGDGGVFCYGDAEFYGSMGGHPLNAPVVSLSPTPDGGGYWLVAADGGIFSFGDARFYGSMGGQHLNEPIVGISTNQAGSGYWLVASDGGVFSFGTAFFGSTGSIRLNQPIVGISATSDGGGYWMVASDGGIFAFGDAAFHGSTGGLPLAQPIVGMATDRVSGGYWLVARDGGVFAFDAPFFGAD